MRLRLTCFFPLLLLAAFPQCARAQKSSAAHSGGTIRGAVYDPAGHVVSHVTVNLLESMAAVAQTQTDQDGKYEFRGLAGGTYTIAANLPGLTKVSGPAVLRDGQTISVDLRLALSAVQEQVVVSASLGGALSPQIGSSVSVFTEQQMRDEGVQTLADALRNIPGVDIARTGELGAVTSAFVRGGNSNYNLVMIDGIPMNDFGGGFDLSPLPVDGVQQVEVTRGPESALYGSNAIASVIDIVSEPGEGSPHFSFDGEGGSYDTWKISTGGAGLTHGIDWSYDLSRLSTQGPVPYDTYRNQTSFVTLGYSPNERRKFVLHFFGDAGHDENPGPWGSNPDGLYPLNPNGTPDFAAAVSFQKQDLFGYQAGYTEQFSDRFRQVSTVSFATDQYEFPASPSNPFSAFTKNERLAANTRSEITLSPHDVLVAGFEYDRATFKNTDVVDPNALPFTLPRDSYAAFAENRWTSGDRWFLSAGVRLDAILTGALPADPTIAARPYIPASSVAQVNPRISVAYLARESSGGAFGLTRIHSSFGTGIRPPDGFELGFTNNPDLKPEKSISGDAGVEQQLFGGKAALDVTYFYNYFTDQIVTLGGSLANLSTFTSANIANSRAYGVESSIHVYPLRSVDLSAEYTWLNSAILALNNTNQTAFPFAVGDPLLRRPRNSAGYDATWTHGRLMLNSNASIHGAALDLEPNYGSYACTLGLQCVFWNQGYIDANAGFAYRFRRGVEIYGHINNFLNQRYEEVFGFPALRLNFISGIRLNFPAERAE
jgi:outer membrane receptor protein involved in Fe transport